MYNKGGIKMSDQQQATVTLNGKIYTQEEFQKEKERLQELKIKLVESGPNTYKTRLND